MTLRGEKRTEFPQSVRKGAFARCCRGGVPYCEGCDAPLGARTGTIYEHVVPDGLAGEPTLENCKVHCRTCADVKTFTEDNPRMAKADAVLKKNYGLGKKKGPAIRSPGFAKRQRTHAGRQPAVRVMRGFRP